VNIREIARTGPTWPGIGGSDANITTDEATTILRSFERGMVLSPVNIQVYQSLVIDGIVTEGYALSSILDRGLYLFMVAAATPDDYQDYHQVEADTWAHEFLHTIGLGPYENFCDNIMSEETNSSDALQDQLEKWQAVDVEHELSIWVDNDVVKRVDDVPCDPTVAALVSDVRVSGDSLGVELTFRTAWEVNHRDFVITRMDRTTHEVADTIAILPPNANRFYSAADPNGHVGDVYWIVERQSPQLPD
jgi:hypothetical protein